MTDDLSSTDQGTWRCLATRATPKLQALDALVGGWA
jgi:hypothetical protein